MTAFESLLAKPIFQALGWTLLHFLWQGAIIAAGFAVTKFFLRRRSANARYLAASIALALMLAAPLITLFITMQSSTAEQNEPAINYRVAAEELPLLASTTEPQPSAIFEPQPTATQSPSQAPVSLAEWAREHFASFLPALVAVWFTGVLFFSLRFLGGLILTGRLREREASLLLDQWQEMLLGLAKQLRVSRPVRLCESILVEVPAVIGWLRPVILVPVSALTQLSPSEIEALLAHELAHIRRYDYLINLLQTAIEALLFYHPAVWWVSRQIREEREHCCDDLAVAVCGSVLIYARALANLEHLRSSEPQLAMAANGGSLLSRIQRLIGRPARASHRFESGLAGVIALSTIIFILAGASTRLLSRASIAEASASAQTISSATQIDSPAGHISAVERANQKSAHASESALSQNEPVTASTENLTASENGTAASNQQDFEPSNAQDYTAAMAALGYQNLKEDEVNALVTHGVSPEFVRGMNNLLNQKIAIDHLIAFRIHGVTSEFVNNLKAIGYTDISADELIAFRVHGVTPEFISDWKSLGYTSLSVDDLLAFRIHGVTPAFAQTLKELGYDRPSADEMTSLRIHGATPEFIQTMKSKLGGALTIEQLTALRIHGASSEFVNQMIELGYSDLKADQVISLRIHGVTPKFISTVRALGFNPTIDQFLQLKIQGVTPEFIEAVKSRGFYDVTIAQLIELRRLNIMPGTHRK